MKITSTNSLTNQQAEQLTRLTQLCKSAEPLTLSCPLDGDMFCLLTQEDGLIGALSVFFQENVWECYAFTRPDHRRQGCFTRLLEHLEAEAQSLNAEPEFCFITDGNSTDALKTLEAIGAEFWYSEHAMIRELTAETDAAAGMDAAEAAGMDAAEAGAATVVETANQSAPSLPRPDRAVHLEAASDPSQPSLYLFTARDSGNTLVGLFSLFVQDGSASLFHVEVPKPLRGQGWGTAMILALLNRLPTMGVTKLILQVSGNNAPAISLYKKTGFRITETLSYYLY